MNIPGNKALPLALLLALAGAAQAADAPAPAQPASAQGASAPPMAARQMDPAAMTERMSAHLGLSPEQTTRVEQINQRFATRLEEHRKQAEAMRAAHQEAMSKIAAERDAELKQVLTPEQYRKHAAQQQLMRERRGEHRGPGPGMGPRAPEAPAQPSPPPPAE